MKLFKNKKGISLIEAVLTVFVLGIGFMSSMQAMQEVVTNTNFSDKEVIATQLASEKIESILLDKITRGFDYVTEVNYPNETLSDPYSGFIRSTDVIEVDFTNLNVAAPPGQSLKRVEVKVMYGNESHEFVKLTNLVGAY